MSLTVKDSLLIWKGDSLVTSTVLNTEMSALYDNILGTVTPETLNTGF